jgi:peptidoglycan hydrolase-like protein with peptidoglycan-binding domain
VPRAATIDSADFSEGGLRALLGRALGRNPLDAVGLVLLLIAAGAILANALYRQPGPHPAPIFSVKPRPVATEPAEGVVPPIPRARPVAAKFDAGARTRADLTADIQRELIKRGLFEGAADGVIGPKTDAAIRDFETLANIKVTGEPSEDLLRALQRGPAKADAAAPRAPARDQISEILSGAAPASGTGQRIVAVQRALNDFGFGPVKATGTIGPETTAAIRKFESDRKMPVTGQVSTRLVRELAALTGRPLE